MTEGFSWPCQSTQIFKLPIHPLEHKSDSIPLPDSFDRQEIVVFATPSWCCNKRTKETFYLCNNQRLNIQIDFPLPVRSALPHDAVQSIVCSHRAESLEARSGGFSKNNNNSQDPIAVWSGVDIDGDSALLFTRGTPSKSDTSGPLWKKFG